TARCGRPYSPIRTPPARRCPRPNARRGSSARQRLRAAAVFGAVAFPALLEHHDWSYLSILLTKAAPGGPLAIELRRTLDSNDPAVLRKFLAEGIHLARTEETKRDQAQIGDDLRIAILRRIERTRTTGMNPALYAAGQKALDGSQADLRRFVETGQFTVLRQSFQVTTPGLPGTLFVRHAQGLGAISPVDGSSSELDKQDSTFVVKPGLADKDCYSLESANIPGAYLRHQSFRIKLADQDGSQVFAEDATFCAAKTQTGSRLESLNMKGRYLRHFRGEIWLADTSGAHEFDSGHMFTEDTTWKVTDPWAPQPR
ncbi:AbfB domain-containing protein, partial [Crossiella equi]|uniref:AbfB domain-containing protein n=1 Tax=Crossiella equi TaxID=130796 RepID=UPI001B8086C9